MDIFQGRERIKANLEEEPRKKIGVKENLMTRVVSIRASFRRNKKPNDRTKIHRNGEVQKSKSKQR